MKHECTRKPLPRVGLDAGRLAATVEALCTPDAARRLRKTACFQGLPSRQALIAIVEDLRTILFPGFWGSSDLTDESVPFHVGCTLDRVVGELRQQIRRGYCFQCCNGSKCGSCERDADDATRGFIDALPEVRRTLMTDVQAHYEADPAATSPDETIFCYPGIVAITNYRLAHALHELEVPLIPRIITEHAHSITGIDIHPRARIGNRFFIDHGTGVVIGATSVVGDGVRLYQGVTLGAKSFPLDENGNPVKGIARHPIVEDDVVVYAGATILGRVTIGRGSVIGGGVWLTQSVPPGSQVTQRAPLQERFEAGGGI